ncbi:oxidative stress-induced growth inhibitor 2 [Eurytemora carolleeae]|uniref:oxidative stress-induced growth inhibitor 2 n=1 Tax=Eurytemora carolleeae TaxID=1294199 RepID=UPI000C781B19|nr:oxidative stress-induced growth inhibitor 2 [Eurytemora carolleeae]XP_023340827.1 oxidative stress-induced growth inhibitor 2 [Eurytemora carolleeae]XP_023340828.1 oxidative stress-induced growth inhibitor 2 [Eurytemora carolleeae]|eukprot:XP_023340826.1 oxidative stress-induced growth inhibitor 2-like [Eurytemora affinis]
MPAAACSGARCCSNHKQNPEINKDQEITETDVYEFVIIGNGPSGISLSYMLSGNWPYYTGESEDELLHTRLQQEPDLSLVEQDLAFLSDGLEGRSNNPVSLLLDTLQHPQADLGLDLPSLLDWRQDTSRRVKHVVLGRGKPGGVWQTLDGNLKTVSLGAWMQLPNLSMPKWEAHNTALVNRRTSFSNVAQYYMDYVDIMDLSQNFRNNTVVTHVKQILHCPTNPEKRRYQPCLSEEKSSSPKICTNKEPINILSQSLKDETGGEDEMFCMEDGELSSCCSSLTYHSSSPSRDSPESSACDRESRERRTSGSDFNDSGRASSSAESKQTPPCDIETSNSFSFSIPGYDTDICPSWDPIINPALFSLPRRPSLNPSQLEDIQCSRIPGAELNSPGYCKLSCSAKSLPLSAFSCENPESLYEVRGYEIQTSETGERETKPFKYLTHNVVLATGLDKPNRLEVPGEELNFVIHSLRELEIAIEAGAVTPNSDPIMIIGAGLSAADAIICAQSYDIPVVHVFRRAVDDSQLIFNKLPVNLYPEYHKIHQMMAEGSVESQRVLRGEFVDREHPRYRAFSQTDVSQIIRDRQAVLKGPFTNLTVKVSFVLVLIGATPDLEFLKTDSELGQVPGAPIERENPIDIDVYTHQSLNVPGLFAMGPLTGDNFVRFLQGGALAITSYSYRKKISSLQDG